MKQRLTLEEKDMKTSPKAKVYARGFYFARQDAIGNKVGFMIDNHTIKRATLKRRRDYLVPLGLN